MLHSEELGHRRGSVHAMVCIVRFAADAFLEQSHLKMWMHEYGNSASKFLCLRTIRFDCFLQYHIQTSSGLNPASYPTWKGDITDKVHWRMKILLIFFSTRLQYGDVLSWSFNDTVSIKTSASDDTMINERNHLMELAFGVETQVLGENRPQCHLFHHKSLNSGNRTQASAVGSW
jgi:hypothetical protein